MYNIFCLEVIIGPIVWSNIFLLCSQVVLFE